MKDVTGRVVQVGDVVACTYRGYLDLVLAKVTKIGQQKFTVEVLSGDRMYIGKTTWKEPRAVCLTHLKDWAFKKNQNLSP